jgi:post-segregation antitoxin (ccd killing protein)
MASITVRISDELKKELQDSGINISEVTRKALKTEIKKIKEQRAREAAQELSQLLSEVPDEEIIKAIRETRDRR